MTDHWPPPGYRHHPTGAGSLARCDRCGVLVGDTDLHDQACPTPAPSTPTERNQA